MARQSILFNRNWNFQFWRPESTLTTHIRGYSLTAGQNALLQTVGIEWPAVTYAIPENNFSLNIKQKFKNYLNKQSSKIQWTKFQTVNTRWPSQPLDRGPLSTVTTDPYQTVLLLIASECWPTWYVTPSSSDLNFIESLTQPEVFLRTGYYAGPNTYADSLSRKTRYLCGQFLTQGYLKTSRKRDK